MLDNNLGPSLCNHSPDLAPLYGHLPGTPLVPHMIDYRSALESRIFGALEHMGMSGTKATGDFTLVNHYLAWHVAQQPILSLGGERRVALMDLLDRYDLAMVAIGGSGSGTMAKWSDFDLMLVAPSGLHPEPELLQGIGSVHTAYLDALRECGIPDIDLPFYSADNISEIVGNAFERSRSPKTVKDSMQRVTSLLSARFLFGERASYEAFIGDFRRVLSENLAPILEVLCQAIRLRHEEFGFTPNRTVPDLKESVGFLRDIDAIRWLEALYSIGSEVNGKGSLFSSDERAALEGAASVMLQLKYTLHHDWQPGNDKILLKQVNTLYPERVTRAFRTFADIRRPDRDESTPAFHLLYEHAGAVSSLLSTALDKVCGEEMLCRHFGGSREPAILAQAPPVHLGTADERLGSALDAIATLARTHPTAQGVRSLAMLPPQDQRLLREIRAACASIGTSEPLGTALYAAFLDQLADVRGAGIILNYMHQSRILERFLPCFGEIRNLSEIGTYLTSSIDLHSIEAVETLGILARREIPELVYLGDIIDEIEDPLPLVLATLLHDVGRRAEAEEALSSAPNPRDHAEIGSELAARDLGHLGVNGRTEQVRWLIEHHSLLTDIAYGIGHLDSEAVVPEVIPSRAILDQLFLLSFVDKYTSNREAFSPEKRRWLIATYNELSCAFEAYGSEPGRKDSISRAHLVQQLSGDAVSAEEVSAHLERLPKSYQFECAPEVILSHALAAREITERLAADSSTCPSIVRFVLIPGGSHLLCDLVVVAPDRSRLFVDIAAALYQRQLSIVSAGIYTRSGEPALACNIFTVRPADYRTAVNGPKGQQDTYISMVLGFADTREKIERSVAAALSESSTFVSVPRTVRGDSCGMRISPMVQIVPISAAGGLCEVKVECEDAPGLAFVIGSILDNHGLEIIQAKLGTGNRGVRNVFRVKPKVAHAELAARLSAAEYDLRTAILE